MHSRPAGSDLSIAVMSHPRRAVQAAALASRLDRARIVVDPSPGHNPTPLKTAVHAWAAAAPEATHHLVVQDDVQISDELLSRIRSGIALFPDDVLTFYSNWNSMTGAMVRLAAGCGATWVEEVGGEYFSTLATVMPSHLVRAYLDRSRQYLAWWPDDDDFMREFIATEGLRAYASVPCLVEHGGLESIAGNGQHGLRRAACFQSRPAYPPGYDALAHSVPFCPWMNSGRVQALVRHIHGGRSIWLRRPWSEAAAAYGLDPDEPARAYRGLVAGSARLQKTTEDLGELFTFSLWLVGFLMGTVVRSGTVPVRPLTTDAVRAGDPALIRTALRTIAPGAINWTTLPASLIATHATESDELVEAGYDSGRTGL
jgi:hypothetical protein